MSDAQPAVSIIMNCLNGADVLPESLASVRTQTFQNFEIVFWDNGSTDNSAEIARAFGEKLRYFKSATTVALGAARNLAIAEARGQYIAFLDCDDLWRPTKLARQIEIFETSLHVGLVCTDTEIYDGKKVLSRLFERGKPERGHVFSALMARQWISMSSAMLRREALDQLLSQNSALAARMPNAGAGWFDESMNVCEEADVFYRVAHDWELDYIDEPLTIWRVHGGNTTFRKFGQFATETERILAKHRFLYPDYDRKYPELIELLTRRIAFQRAIDLWRSGHNARARKIIGPYLANSPKYKLFRIATYLPGSMFDLLARLYFALPARFGN